MLWLDACASSLFFQFRLDTMSAQSRVRGRQKNATRGDEVRSRAGRGKGRESQQGGSRRSGECRLRRDRGERRQGKTRHGGGVRYFPAAQAQGPRGPQPDQWQGDQDPREDAASLRGRPGLQRSGRKDLLEVQFAVRCFLAGIAKPRSCRAESRSTILANG